jgi:hypothetical protein
MDVVHRNLIMKEVANDLASLISFVNLESQEVLIEEYVQLTREQIFDENIIMSLHTFLNSILCDTVSIIFQ